MSLRLTHSTRPLAGAAALLAALLGLPACPAPADGDTDTDEDPGTGAATDTGATTAAATDGATDTEAATDPQTGTDGQLCADLAGGEPCCCFTADDAGHDVTCAVESLCPGFSLGCGNGNDHNSDAPCYEVSDAAALECALTALAQGAAGSFNFHLANTKASGFWSKDFTYYLVGDGTAYVYPSSFYDTLGNSGPVRHHALKPAQFFADCLASSDLDERATCLAEAWEADELRTCTEIGNYDPDEV